MMQVVLGMGEVGTAVAEVLHHQYGVIPVDVDSKEVPEHTHALHVCYPWSDKFMDITRDYIEEYNPEVTVIHSTVPVGTSSALGACHSPIRGRHPHLTESLLTFVKFFGGENANKAAKIFYHCDVPVETVEKAETTEAGKLWELLMYGLAIAQQKEMYDWCEKNGADPSVAYKRFTETYNDGYIELGLPNVARPIIEQMPGKIGGHCIIENAPLIDNDFAELLLQLNENW